MVCKNCGTMNSADARFCAKCGADMSLQYNDQAYNAQQQQQQSFDPYAQNNAYQNQNYNYPNPGASAPTPGKGLAIASMVCGIVTLALFCIWYVSLVTGILSIIFGAIAKSKGFRSGMSTAGIVCGSIGLGLMILFIVIVALGVIGAMGSSYYYF